MIDIEEHLTRYLHERAATVDIREDLDNVVKNRAARHRSGGEHGRPRIVSIRIVAAALIAAAIVSIVWIGTRDSTEKRSIDTSAAGPQIGNGVIVVSRVDGWGQVDPSGKQRSVRLPADIVVGQRGYLDSSWSPDGTEIVYSNQGGIWIADVESGARRQIGDCVSGQCEFAWSPDGTAIAVGGAGIILIDPHGPANQTGEEIVVPGDAPSELSWTPDSERIIFTSIADPGIYGIESVSRDGSDRSTVIASQTTRDTYEYLDLSLSPDGSELAWIRGKTAVDGSVTLQLMTADADGSNVKVLRELNACFCLGGTPGFTWSPDGKQIAVVVPSEAMAGTFELFIANRDGTNFHSLGVQANGKPSWQPVIVG